MIKIANLEKEFISRSKERVRALDGISLELPERGLVFILGESGSGKSTLLNILGGIERADGGSILVDGKEIIGCSDRDLDIYRNKDVGFVFQEFNLLQNFNVGDNVKLACDLQSDKDNDKAVEVALSAVSMGGYSKHRVSELSGGQKQRVAIARAIVKKPRIILADEPTGSLDMKIGRSILELLKSISQDSLVLAVSHDETFAREYGDVIIRLEQGKIIETVVKNEDVHSKINDAQQNNLEKAVKVNKYSLSSKTTAKMALFNLGTKKFRLAMTIIMCVVCLAAFGIADAVASWDPVNAGMKVLESSGDHILTVRNDSESDLKGAELYDYLIYMQERKLIPIKELIMPDDNNNFAYGYYPRYIEGFSEIDQQTVDNLGYELTAGRLPNEFGETAITLHTYRSFKAGKYQSNTIDIDGKDLNADDGENGILGKNISVSWGNGSLSLKIVGIVDTKFNYEGYGEYDPQSENYISHQLGYSDERYSGHGVLFVSDGDVSEIDSLLRKSDYEYGVPTGGRYEFANKIVAEVQSSQRSHYSSTLDELRSSGAEIIWFGEEKRELEDNEVIISYLTIEKLFKYIKYLSESDRLRFPEPITVEYIDLKDDKIVKTKRTYEYMSGAYLDDYAKSRIYAYAKDHLADYQDIDNFESLCSRYPESEREMTLAYWLQSVRIVDDRYITAIDGGYAPYGGHVSGLELSAKAKIELLKGTDLINMVRDVNIEYMFNGSIEGSIAGVYIPTEHNNLDSIAVNGTTEIVENRSVIVNPYINKNDLQNIQSQKICVTKGTKLIDGKGNDLMRILEIYLPDWGQMGVSNRGLTSVSTAISDMNIIKQICMWAALVLGIISALMFANYLVGSIMARKREIGILRAIGATASDVFMISLCEAAIIFAINFVLSVIFGGVMSLLINIGIRSLKFDLDINMIMYGFRQIALMFAVSAVVTLVVSLIGSYSVSKRRPSYNIKQ